MEVADQVFLSPIHFIQMRFDCPFLEEGDKINSKRYLVPDTTDLGHESPFADLYMGWNNDGIKCYLKVWQPVKEVHYPSWESGDSLELFIDTRDVKTSGFNTRFCHHFVFLPELVEGHHAAEVTHFRTEDAHELCDPNALKIESHLKQKAYTMELFIPKSCLHGYDPDQFDRMGFTYRVNRPGGTPQEFAVHGEHFATEQQPSLWSSVRLVR